MTIEDLRSLMRIPSDASESEIQEVFDSIAECLMNNCVICFENDEYRILDFEFYFYNKNHRDITVHPRKSEALCWYINDFGGIDLNFESRIERDDKCYFKYKLTNDSYFGGILIRQIQRVADKYVFDGPLKVAELFRTFDATSHEQKNPVLEIRTSNDEIDFYVSTERYNLLGTHKGLSDDERIMKKVKYNLQQCFTTHNVSEDTLVKELKKEFINRPYRYCWKSK